MTAPASFCRARWRGSGRLAACRSAFPASRAACARPSRRPSRPLRRFACRPSRRASRPLPSRPGPASASAQASGVTVAQSNVGRGRRPSCGRRRRRTRRGCRSPRGSPSGRGSTRRPRGCPRRRPLPRRPRRLGAPRSARLGVVLVLVRRRPRRRRPRPRRLARPRQPCRPALLAAFGAAGCRRRGQHGRGGETAPAEMAEHDEGDGEAAEAAEEFGHRIDPRVDDADTNDNVRAPEALGVPRSRATRTWVGRRPRRPGAEAPPQPQARAEPRRRAERAQPGDRQQPRPDGLDLPRELAQPAPLPGRRDQPEHRAADRHASRRAAPPPPTRRRAKHRGRRDRQHGDHHLEREHERGGPPQPERDRDRPLAGRLVPLDVDDRVRDRQRAARRSPPPGTRTRNTPGSPPVAPYQP